MPGDADAALASDKFLAKCGAKGEEPTPRTDRLKKAGNMGREKGGYVRDAASGKYLSRKDFLKGLAAVGVGATGGLNLLTHKASGEFSGMGGMDALQHRIYYELKVFTDWLGREKVRGYIGEVNWPNNKNRGFVDATQWNVLGERWYRWADAARLWVTMHCVDEYQRWGGFWLTTYVSAGDGKTRAISKPMAQASVFEQHSTTEEYKRGLQVASGQRWHSGLSNRNPGIYDKDYWYASQATMNYLHGRGVKVIRLPFRWERVQPVLGAPLDPTELQRLRACVSRAGAAGLEVILSLQNYGGYFRGPGKAAREYKLGSPGLPTAYLHDVWNRLSIQFKDDPKIIAYDLMNEPYNHGGIIGTGYTSPQKRWEILTQGLVNTIRANNDHTLLMIPGYSHIHKWSTNHPKKWITDPSNNHMYTAHHYFDSYRGPGTGGGNYGHSYNNETAYWHYYGY